MSDSIRQELNTVWQQLAQRNNWQLVSNHDVFLSTVATEFQLLGDDTPFHQRARIAVLRAYGLRLYHGLQARQDRAAYEIWLACYRLARRDGLAPSEAEVAAQETIARVLEKLHTLHTPQSIISWSLRIFRTVRMALMHPRQAEQPIHPDNEVELEVADAADMAAEVEQRVLSQQLIAILQAKLPNWLERLVLLRVVIFGDQPRDVARDLGLPLYRTRLAKSRALERLREDEHIRGLLSELAGTTTGPISRGYKDGSEDV